MAEKSSRRPTIADVARLAGTSTAVVSYVVNDGPRPVAPETRARVLAAVDELRYQPNRIARALRSRSTGVVGLVLPDIANPYFAALGTRLEKELARHGKLTLVANAGYSAERQERLVERFLAAQVDGLIILRADGKSNAAARAKLEDVPLVYVHNPGAEAPAVHADNDQSVREAIEHLVAHGHQQVGLLAGPDDSGPVGTRRQVWSDHPNAEPAWLMRCDYSRAAAADLTAAAVADRTLPPALLVATDEQAIGVLSGVQEAGLHVPRDVALISLDGTPESAYTVPALTVTKQPIDAMAARAVALLLGETPIESPLAAVLVRRRSCGCSAAVSPPPEPPLS
jgi:LacI family transcriptional regulator